MEVSIEKKKDQFIIEEILVHCRHNSQCWVWISLIRSIWEAVSLEEKLVYLIIGLVLQDKKTTELNWYGLVQWA
jgi:hypothetical protein